MYHGFIYCCCVHNEEIMLNYVCVQFSLFGYNEIYFSTRNVLSQMSLCHTVSVWLGTIARLSVIDSAIEVLHVN